MILAFGIPNLSSVCLAFFGEKAQNQIERYKGPNTKHDIGGGTFACRDSQKVLQCTISSSTDQDVVTKRSGPYRQSKVWLLKIISVPKVETLIAPDGRPLSSVTLRKVGCAVETDGGEKGTWNRFLFVPNLKILLRLSHGRGNNFGLEFYLQ